MNLLDDPFYVDTKIYQPCKKPDNTPIYINKNSDHQVTVLRQLPKSMANRLLALLNVISTSQKTVKKSDHLIHNFQSRYFYNYHDFQAR